MSIILNSIEQIKKTALANLEEEGNVAPMFFLSDGKEVKILPVSFSNNDDKDQIMRGIKHLIQVGKISEYLFISESWTVSLKKDESVQKQYDEYGSLADHPQREEILFMQYSSMSEEVLHKANIIREGDKASLGKWEIFGSTKKEEKVNFAGRFSNMFEKSMAAFN